MKGALVPVVVPACAALAPVGEGHERFVAELALGFSRPGLSSLGQHEYNQRPERKRRRWEHPQKPEVKRRKADYLAHYRGRPEVKERLHNHRQRPEYKDWMREYNQRPERKAWFKIPVKCECGIMSSNGHISRHRKSAQHDHRLAGTREVEQ